MSNRKRWLILLALVACTLLSASCRFEKESEAERERERERGAPTEPRAPAAKRDRDVLVLTSEQVRAAGIVVTRAAPRPIREILDSGGAVAAIPDREAKVTSRLAGRVARLLADPGDAVEAGGVLAVLDSPDAAERRARVRAAEERLALARRTLAREERLAQVGNEETGPVLEARLRRDRAATDLSQAQRTYERARRLHPEVVSTRELDAARAAMDNAHAELATAEQLYRRQHESARERLTSRRETDRARGDVDAARVELSTAREALEALGVGGGSGGEVAVRAPIGGTVVTRPVTLGSWLEAGGVLFTLLDRGRVWCMVDVRAADLPRVCSGLPAEIRSDAAPGRVYAGTVSKIDPGLDPQARTARARIEIANPDGLLRVDLPVAARIVVRARGHAPAVPAEAVQVEDGRDVVYVARSAGRFERRFVQADPAESGWRAIRSGVRPGEMVAAKGSFLIKSERERERLGEEKD